MATGRSSSGGVVAAVEDVVVPQDNAEKADEGVTQVAAHASSRRPVRSWALVRSQARRSQTQSWRGRTRRSK